MNKDHIYDDFAAYFSGELSVKEKNLLEEKIKVDKETLEQFTLAKTFWTEANYPEKDKKNSIVQKTLRKIHQSGKKHKKYRIAYYAAAVVAILFISSTIFFVLDEKPEIKHAYASSGEVKSFTLEDGTTVWLNAESKLSYPVTFSRRERRVILDGEAYFSVTSDKKHPFIVSTNKIDVLVTGTKFNVSAYNNDPIVSTFLEEGEVSVDNKESKSLYEITPGYMFELDKGTKDISIRKADLKHLTAWKKGELSFYNEDFESIARKLERKFGVKIILGNSEIKKLKYTAEFDKEGINEILDFLDCARTMDVKVNGLVYYISEKES